MNTLLALAVLSFAQDLPVVEVEGQPLAANAERVMQAMTFLGSPHPLRDDSRLRDAVRRQDGAALQRLLDPFAVLVVHLNPEMRVKVQRGPGSPRLQQGGFTPLLIKVVNESTATPRLRLISPQMGAVYSGASLFSLQRQKQPQLNNNENTQQRSDRFLDAEFYRAPPMTDRLSGLTVEYLIALFYSSDAGKREALIGVDADQGNQDLGFRGETPVLFDIQEAWPVTLDIKDETGKPTTARLTFRDAQGRVYPPRPKRLAPDFFFQDQVYRRDGESIILPPGELTVVYCRGPEYQALTRQVVISGDEGQRIELQLKRWINPADYGFYSGDHHIHAAGCAHYTAPTQGVSPADMFRQVQGEGLNVGCVLTWGPCFDFQRQFFSNQADAVSEPLTVLKYDLEISGFGSQALGHVCLLNLKDQVYPESDGTSTKGWPTWTTPVLRWAKQQGGVTGYAHSASGLHIDPEAASERLIQRFDNNQDQQLQLLETSEALLPAPFAEIDADNNQALTLAELIAAHRSAAEQLPNLAIPEMSGVGAMEICVAVHEGVCDFISAMDTRRIQEWNTWYHLLNCGYALKVSGETDFPCMSSTRVGQGRVYVQLGPRSALDFSDWCQGLAEGRSYVSDGFAHALRFEVAGKSPGNDIVQLDQPRTIHVEAEVAFAPTTPMTVGTGLADAPEGKPLAGDTVQRLLPPGEESWQTGGQRRVELIVNGQVVAEQVVPADGEVHDVAWDIPLAQSSWVAIRHFPQLHTNPVTVQVAGEPMRASRRSAQWCAEMTEQLWRHRSRQIHENEREAAKLAFDRAIAHFRQLAQYE